ncbi:MAG: hypothetical protein RL417_982 [Pseudomonadota bacterium]|jgi:hypothetical protein
MRRLVVVAVVLWGIAGLTGCSPGLGNSLPIGAVPTPAVKGSSPGDSPVRIQSFIDARPARTVAVGERLIRAEGDVPGKVQVALSDFLKANGFRLSAGDSASIRGAVLDWGVVVTPGFPSSVVEGNATVELEAYGIDSTERYVRRYTGNAVTRHPFLNEEKIRQTMGEAMGYALQAAMEDSRLLDHLRRSVPTMVPW